MHEYIVHECHRMCKKLARARRFRKPAVAAASRRPARADGLKVGLDGRALQQASAPSELRGALGRLGYLCAGGAKAMFVAAADHTVACSMLPGPRSERRRPADC